MVTATFYSEVKRLYTSLQDLVGLRRKKRSVVISEPFNFRREPTVLPGLTEDELVVLSILREKAAASRLGIAHAIDPSRAATPTLFPTAPHRRLAKRRSGSGPLTSSPPSHPLGGTPSSSTLSLPMMMTMPMPMPRLEVTAPNPPTPPRTPTPSSSLMMGGGGGKVGPIPIPIPGAGMEGGGGRYVAGKNMVEGSSSSWRSGSMSGGGCGCAGSDAGSDAGVSGGGGEGVMTGSPRKGAREVVPLSATATDLEMLLFGNPSGTGSITNTSSKAGVAATTAAITTATTTTTRCAGTPTKQAGIDNGVNEITSTTTDKGREDRDLPKLVMPLPSTATTDMIPSSLSSDMVSPLEEARVADCWDMDFEFQLGSPVSPLSPRPRAA
ncbi:hypothetical protein VTJ49DRAFT_1012 [Mycothermus thermophilus]|uniref:Uncharacterized protein n=1 Tax=Humicola insolens TaxID=85995 RepID=A0ABR3VDJ6_HUMIN